MKKHIVTFLTNALETDQILVSVRSFYFTSGTIFCTYLHDVKYCLYLCPLLNLHPHAPPNLSISTAVLETLLLGRVPQDLIQPLKFSMYLSLQCTMLGKYEVTTPAM